MINPKVPPTLCAECLYALQQEAISAKPSSIGIIRWCGHNRTHAFLTLDGALVMRAAPTEKDAEDLDRAYEQSLSHLVALESALLAALPAERGKTN